MAVVHVNSQLLGYQDKRNKVGNGACSRDDTTRIPHQISSYQQRWMLSEGELIFLMSVMISRFPMSEEMTCVYRDITG